MSEQQATPDLRDWIRERIEDRIDLEAPLEQYDPWTSVYHVQQDIKYGQFNPEAVAREIEVLVDQDELINWNGWIAPRREEVLRAINQAEDNSDVPRSILVGACNRALQDLDVEADDAGEVAASDD